MKVKSCILIVLLIFIINVFADNSCKTYPGACICVNGSIKNIDGTYGSLILNDMHVEGSIQGIFGAVKIDKSKLNEINSTIGALLIENTDILNKIIGTIGTIQLKNCSLSEVDAQTQNVTLNNSELKSMTIYSTENKVTVHLKNYSSVNGDISFSKNLGKVCVDKTSQIKGNIVNGELMEGNC